jgi:hypothetical protein
MELRLVSENLNSPIFLFDLALTDKVRGTLTNSGRLRLVQPAGMRRFMLISVENKHFIDNQ